jgi:hypothetical protein
MLPYRAQSKSVGSAHEFRGADRTRRHKFEANHEDLVILRERRETNLTNMARVIGGTYDGEVDMELFFLNSGEYGVFLNILQGT